MVKYKGSVNLHASTIQEQATTNTALSEDLAAKMDKIFRVIQGYEEKIDITMELILDMQKRFEEKLEALKQYNNAIKAQLNGQGSE